MREESSRRVVITGMGWVTPLGHDLETVWDRLARGESGVAEIDRFDAATFPTTFAAQVRDYDYTQYLADPGGPGGPDAHARAGLHTQFALGAARQAWEQARLGSAAGETPERRYVSEPGSPDAMSRDWGPLPRPRGGLCVTNASREELFARTGHIDPRRIGIYLGAGEGVLDFDSYSRVNLAAWDAQAGAIDARRWVQAAGKLMDPWAEIEQEPNMPMTHLARAFGIRGPAYNCLTACAASTQAIGEAMSIIQRDEADVMISGGTHTMLHVLGVTGFNRLTALSNRNDDPLRASRPFDRTRDGFVMGEGSGIVILEELEHALRRGATPIAEIVGYGSSADAFRITDIQPEGRGAAAAMLDALQQAGIDPHAVDESGTPLVHYISAHGTGTQENDSIETRAVKAVFGGNAKKIPVSSIKSMMGHLIAAAGAVELIACVLALQNQTLPPTINLENPDPELDLDYVPNQARPARIETVLSNSFGFGGQNDTIIVRRYRP